MKKIIIVVLVLAIVLGIIFYVVTSMGGSNNTDQNKPVTLKVWGLWEDPNLLQPAIDEYKKENPNATIEYVRQTPNNYRSRVQTQISAGEGPDIFMIHNAWKPMFIQSGSLSAMPDSILSYKDFEDSFDPVVVDSFSDTQAKRVFALPRGIDGLSLYYNEDILQAAGVTSIPQTWEDFINAAVKTTVINSQGQVQTAGAALGTTGNVDHWSDILGLLFLQNPGANLENPNTNEGVEVLTFYTNFVTKADQKTWDANLEHSTNAFAAGKLAFYFAPSWRIFDIHQMNPNLNFKTAPVPQLPQKKVGWGTFWGYAVSSKSFNQTEAWKFLKFLTSAPAQKLLYQQASGVRLYGLPYSQKSLQNEITSEERIGSFVKQAPDYKSWYLSSNTSDQGINDEMIKYYEDAVNAVVFQGATPQGALETAQKGVEQTLDKYTKPVAAGGEQ
jgi:multiple sugar transport system substrate-binding protein